MAEENDKRLGANLASTGAEAANKGVTRRIQDSGGGE
jgi:hypothetical protein